MPVGVEEFFQVCNLGSQLGAFVGIGHEHAVGRHFYYLCRALDVSTPLYRIGGRSERLVLYKLKSPTVVYESISCDTCFLVVCLAEPSVYDHKFSIGFDWILTF